MRKEGLLAVIEESFLTPSGRLILHAGVLVGKAKVANVELQFNLFDCLPAIRDLERLKFLRFGRETLGLVGVVGTPKRLHGIPFRLLLSQVDLAGHDECVVAHVWDFAPASESPKTGKR